MEDASFFLPRRKTEWIRKSRSAVLTRNDVWSASVAVEGQSRPQQHRGLVGNKEAVGHRALLITTAPCVAIF